jgi:iron-sulfur cluster repair protein YtfE (RIC family)
METSEGNKLMSAQAPIDFTVMYAAHDAFRRDLDRFAAIVDAGKAGSPHVRDGWENFKRQLRIHHTAEDAALWPRFERVVRRKPRELALLKEMEHEHSLIDPLLAAVDEALPDPADDLGEHVHELRTALDKHLSHEEMSALPLIQSVLTQADWQGFTAEIRRRQGLKGAAVFVPWVVDGIRPTDRSRFLAAMPPPVRALNRLTWEPRYRKLRLWTV